MLRSTVLATLLTLASPAFADHHGRGKEPTDGFPGVYDAGGGMLTFTGDGYLVVVMKRSTVAVSVHSYDVTDDVLTLRDVSPPAFLGDEAKRCSIRKKGRYTIVHGEEASWTLEAIKEPCEARKKLMERIVLNPYVRNDGASTEG